MKVLLPIISLLVSFSTFAGPSQTELINEIDGLISKLNMHFHLSVTKQIDEDCGFRASESQESSSEYQIHFCLRDINFFSSLEEAEKPIESLLTIIAHEYGHFLLDYQGIKPYEESLSSLSSDIYQMIKNDPILLTKLKKIFIYSENPPEGWNPSVEQISKMAIEAVLLLGTHENVDSLSIKLLHLVSYEADTNAFKYFPKLYHLELTENVRLMIEARTEVLKISEMESISRWDNYLCVGLGIESEEYAPALKQTLQEHGFSQMKERLARGCEKDKVYENFFRLLDKYYSNF